MSTVLHDEAQRDDAHLAQGSCIQASGQLDSVVREACLRLRDPYSVLRRELVILNDTLRAIGTSLRVVSDADNAERAQEDMPLLAASRLFDQEAQHYPTNNQIASHSVTEQPCSTGCSDEYLKQYQQDFEQATQLDFLPSDETNQQMMS